MCCWVVDRNFTFLGLLSIQCLGLRPPRRKRYQREILPSSPDPWALLLSPSLALLEAFAELQNFPEQSHEHMHNQVVALPVPHTVQSTAEASSCTQARCFAGSSCEQHAAGKRLPETWDSLNSWSLGISRLKSQSNCGSLPRKGPWEQLLSEKDH